MSARPAAVGRTALRAVLYLRQSTYREESISLELQEEAARAYAERQGYRVVAVEADPGITGRTWKRPAVQRVMAMLERGDADRVILWKWSRLSRDDYDWAVARRIAATAGGRIESATEPNPEDSAEGKLMLSQMISFAVYESDRIGAVWKDVHAHRRRAGLPAQGGDRYGYERTASGFRPHPEQSLVLAQMYRRHIDGVGFAGIAKWLNDAGIPNRVGNAWSRPTITSLLDSGFGAGLIIEGSGRDATYHPGAHEPVISAAEWEQYRERRAETRATPPTTNAPHFLSGLMRCGDCGAPMSAKNRGGVTYVCNRWSEFRDVRIVTASRRRAEAAVEAWLRELGDDVERQSAIEAKHAASAVTAVDDGAAIDRLIAALDVRLATLTTRYLDGKVPEAAYAATSARLQADHESLRERRQRASRRSRRTVDLSALRPTLDLWERLTIDERRRFACTLIRAVRVTPRPGPPRRGGGGGVTFEIVDRFDE